MKRIFSYLLVAGLGGLLTCLPGCSRQDEPLPVAAPASGVARSPAGARAQAWFAGLKNTPASQKGSTASRTEGDAQPTIDWERATYADEYVVAPFADTDNPFAASQHYGYRFLVVRTAADSCTGRIVELIARQAIGPEQTAQLALAGTRPLLAGQAPGAVQDFTGSLLVYSPAYAYETGFAYKAGTLQPLRMAPGPVGPDTCYDYYLVGYDNTGAQVIHEFLYTFCTGGIPGVGGGWGGDGTTTGSGGGGGGGNVGPRDGTFNTTSTSDTYNTTPPADCNSWQFNAVGPSNYMACGVANMRIDVLSQYTDASGTWHVEYVHWTFDTYPLYFEMPPRYTPGQAATICAGLKDDAESFVEQQYGNTGPLTGQVIANAFYSRLASLMRPYGGRLSKSQNYPNTPVAQYGEALSPGGCF